MSSQVRERLLHTRREKAKASGQDPDDVTDADLSEKTVKNAADAFIAEYMKFITMQPTTAARDEATKNPRNFISMASAVMVASDCDEKGHSDVQPDEFFNADSTSCVVNNFQADVASKLMLVLDSTSPEEREGLKFVTGVEDEEGEEEEENDEEKKEEKRGEEKKEEKRGEKNEDDKSSVYHHGSILSTSPFRIQSTFVASASGDLCSSWHLMADKSLPADVRVTIPMPGCNRSRKVCMSERLEAFISDVQVACACLTNDALTHTTIMVPHVSYRSAIWMTGL